MSSNDRQRPTPIPPSPVMRQDVYQINSRSDKFLEKATKIRGLAARITHDVLRAPSENGLDTVLGLMIAAEKVLEIAQACSNTLRGAEGAASSGQAPTVDEHSSASEWGRFEERLQAASTLAGLASVASAPESLPSQASIPGAKAAMDAPVGPTSRTSLPPSRRPQAQPRPLPQILNDNKVALSYGGLASLKPGGGVVQTMHSYTPDKPSPLSRVTSINDMPPPSFFGSNKHNNQRTIAGAATQSPATPLDARPLTVRPRSS